MIFLPIVFVIYWAIPHKYRWVLLLLASYYFYMSWNAKYVVLILGTTLVSYLAARIIEWADNSFVKKSALILSMVICLGVLFFFKYFNFFAEGIAEFFAYFSIQLHPATLKLLLPVGISFYTFQTMSYVIDVYNGKVKAEHHFGIYATFISFFPQLVAGPIERTKNLLPQIKEEHHFDKEKAEYGIRMMMWGFFKKLVIADNLATYVDKIFNSVTDFKGVCFLIATLCFTIQIYCDFSGYSDIAIGTAKLLEIDLMTNFESPYFSGSIKEFWSRWHVSLSTWFRDYVYIPLGGNRVGKIRHKINLLITFLLSGLWHGANWTFVAWGTLHGGAQVIESCFPQNKGKKRRNPIRVICVFMFVAFAWIFFRANCLWDVKFILSNMFYGISNPAEYFDIKKWYIGTSDADIYYNLVVMLINIFILGIFDFLSLKKDIFGELAKNKVLDWAFMLTVFSLILLFRFSGETNFVYFQF